MPTVRKLLAIPLILLMPASSPAFADPQHVVSPQQLAATVEQHTAQQDADRAAVREALARPEVRDMAGKMGVDLTRATAAVDTMGAIDLEQAARAARQVNRHLVGGSTVTISTTTIIIVLLLIILLVVAIK